MAEKRPLRGSYSRQKSGPSEVSLVRKYILFAMNVLFWTFGLGMILIGLYSKTEKMDDELSSTLPWFINPSTLILITGSVLTALPFLGCLGSLRENITLLKIFEYTINILCIIELALVIYICVDSQRMKSNVEEFFQKSIPRYRDDTDLQSIIDWTQSTMKCCGVKDYNDWDKNSYFRCTKRRIPNPERCGVPFSCCIDYNEELNTQCGYRARTSDNYERRYEMIYSEGCVDATIRYLLHEDRVILLCIVGGLVLLAQLVSSGLAHCLVNDIRMQKAKWHRERRDTLNMDNRETPIM